MTIQFPDQYRMTRDMNVRYARSNFTRLVHTTARFEGVNTTLPQTQTIMDGMGVDGVSLADIDVIVALKRGWDYITRVETPLDLGVAKQINAIVAAKDALIPGAIRTGQGSVMLNDGTDFVPPLVDEGSAARFFQDTMAAETSATDKALTVMYHLMRTQLFWDGNKRTATLAANKVMIDHGAGLINVPLAKWGHWNDLISAFYRSGSADAIKEWTYQNGIQGPTLD